MNHGGGGVIGQQDEAGSSGTNSTRRYTTLRTSIWLVVRVILALTPLVSFGTILWLIRNRTPRVAWWDEWVQFFPLLQALDAGTLNAGQILEPTDEHRLVIPRLVGIAVISVTNWNRQIQMIVYLFIGLVTLLLILDAVRRTFGSANAAIILAGPLALVMLSLTQYENWLWPLGFGFIITSFAAALCVWAMTARTGWTALLIGASGGLLAVLSTAAGPVIWIAFLPAVCLLGKKYAAVWATGTLTVVIFYLSQNAHSAEPSTRPGNAAEMLHALQYMAAFLAGPISTSRLPWPLAAVPISAILLLVSVAVLYRLGTNRLSLLSWLGLAGVSVGCAALIALGRASYTTELYIPSRYDGFSALWWVATIVLVALCTYRLADARRQSGSGIANWQRPLILASNAVGCAALLVALITANLAGFRQGYAWMDFPIKQEQCVMAPRYASDACLSIFSIHPSLLRQQLRFLEERQFGIYQGREPFEVNNLQVSSEPATGAISMVNRQPVRPAKIGAAASVLATPAATAEDDEKTQLRQQQRLEKRADRAPDSSSGAALVVPSGQYIPVRGWATLSTPAMEPAGGAIIVVDDAEFVWAAYGQSPPDAAIKKGDTPSPGSGFVAFLPPDLLPVGQHNLQVMVLTPDLQSYVLLPKSVTLDVQDLPAIDIAGLTSLDQTAYGLIGTINDHSIPNRRLWPYVEPANEPLEIHGWAFDPLNGTSAGNAFLLVDDRLTFPVQVGIPRGEVAMGVHEPPLVEGIDFMLVGYKSVIPAGALAPGRHTIEVRIVTRDGRSHYAASPTLTIQIDLK